MFNKHLIPNAHTLTEGKAFNMKVAEYDFLITKYEGKLLAYENLCPQQSKPLNNPLGKDQEGLKSEHHDALFSPRDGSFITGPYQGSRLKKATIGIVKGDCYLLLG